MSDSSIPLLHRCAQCIPGHSVHWVQARQSWLETHISELPTSISTNSGMNESDAGDILRLSVTEWSPTTHSLFQPPSVDSNPILPILVQD